MSAPVAPVAATGVKGSSPGVLTNTIRHFLHFQSVAVPRELALGNTGGTPQKTGQKDSRCPPPAAFRRPGRSRELTQNFGSSARLREPISCWHHSPRSPLFDGKYRPQRQRCY